MFFTPSAACVINSSENQDCGASTNVGKGNIHLEMFERKRLGFGGGGKAARRRLSPFEGWKDRAVSCVVFGQVLPWPEGYSLGTEMEPELCLPPAGSLSHPCKQELLKRKPISSLPLERRGR